MKSIIINIFLAIGAFTVGFFVSDLLRGTNGSAFESGSVVGSSNVTLHVLVVGPDSLPVSGLEVDLWHDTTRAGPPDAAVSFTNSSGIAVFAIPKGGYLIGFNLINFPSELEAPREMPVSVSDDFNNATINLFNKV